MQDYNINLVAQTIWSVMRIILDIGFVWILIYYALKVFKNNSRTIQIVKGVILVLVANALAKIFGFEAIGSLTDMFINWGLLAIIIIFQPEIRSALERIGKTDAYNRIDSLFVNERAEVIDSVHQAVTILSDNQVGALLAIERNQSLEDYIRSGIRLDSDISSELLLSIFMTTTPLHDGAVIIRGKKIACASTYFPSTSKTVPNKYGSRHRAALGLSEISDALIIVVSEETSEISIASNGVLTTVSKDELLDYLNRVFLGEEVSTRRKRSSSFSLFSEQEHEIEKEEERISLSDIINRDRKNDQVKVPINNRKKSKSLNLKTNNTEDNDEDKKE